jgi:predicted secreted hydrolase
MKNYSAIPYREEDHGSFDEEWLPHKGATGWWYATGYLNDVDNPQDLYSFQFTLAKIERMRFTLFVSMIAFTNVQTQEHIFHQKLKMLGKITATKDEVSFLPHLSLTKESDPWQMMIKTDKIKLDLDGIRLRKLFGMLIMVY